MLCIWYNQMTGAEPNVPTSGTALERYSKVCQRPHLEQQIPSTWRQVSITQNRSIALSVTDEAEVKVQNLEWC